MRVRRHTLAACALCAALACAPLLAAPAPARPRQPAAQQPQQQSAQQPPAGQQPPPQTPTPRQQQPTPPARADDVDDEVLTVDTSLVNVVFNATDRDRRFVTTLRREDLRIFEDGVPQEITVFQRETELPLSIAILVDVSGSQENTLPIEKEAARAFVNSILRPGQDHAAVVSFTGEAVLEQDLTQELDSLHFAIEGLRVILPPTNQVVHTGSPPIQLPPGLSGGGAGGAGTTGASNGGAAGGTAGASAPPPGELEEDSPVGWTSVWDAIWATSNEVMSQTPSHTRRAIILLSDGDDTRSRLKREEAAEAAVRANTVVYSIGVEPYCEVTDCELDKSALRKISEATGGRAFFPKDETELNAAFHQIQQELRTQYLAAYAPTNKARDGGYRRLKIELVNPELKKQKLKLAYREGYFALSPRAAAQRRERAPQDRLPRPPKRRKK